MAKIVLVIYIQYMHNIQKALLEIISRVIIESNYNEMKKTISALILAKMMIYKLCKGW